MFVENGGTDVLDITQDHGSIVIAPTTTRTGYKFDGWYTSSDNGVTLSVTAYEFTTMPQENITLYADWTINQYTYTFYDEDGTTELKKETVDYGTQITAPVDPSKDATAEFTYTFDGWYDAKIGGSKVTTFGTLDENGATYYARYTSVVNKYTYTFYDENGITELKKETVDFGTQITAPDNPGKEATAQYTYTFDGWYDAKIGGSKVTTFGTLDENGAIYYARYTSVVNKYTITFDSKGGSTVEKSLMIMG